MGQSQSKQQKQQASKISGPKCPSCNKQVDSQSIYCKYCGSGVKKVISDEQYQKQLSMKYQKQKQLQEIKVNKKQITKASTQKETQINTGDMKQIQICLKQLQEQIAQHRLSVIGDKETSCWKFGFDFSGDYKQVWSSTSYWRSLIKSNKKICTNDMHFLKCKTCCQKCAIVIQKLQSNKILWENLVVRQYQFLNN